MSEEISRPSRVPSEPRVASSRRLPSSERTRQKLGTHSELGGEHSDPNERVPTPGLDQKWRCGPSYPNIVYIYFYIYRSLCRCAKGKKGVWIKNGDAALLLFGGGSTRRPGWYSTSTPLIQTRLTRCMQLQFCSSLGAHHKKIEALYLLVS